VDGFEEVTGTQRCRQFLDYPVVDQGGAEKRGLRLEIDGRATWVLGADQDDARRLAASITEAT